MAALAVAAPAPAQTAADRELVREAVLTACRSPGTPPVGDAHALPAPFRQSGNVSEWNLPASGGRIRISLVGRGSRQLTFADLYRVEGSLRPVFRAVAGAGCNIIGGRWIEYGPVAGRTLPISVHHLDSTLSRSGAQIPLNPPAPRLQPRNCIRVGLLDNGVNYLRSDLARRLAYDENGRLVGLDVWEGDGRPFDYGAPPGAPHPRVSIFNPRRHGSAVASVLLHHAPASACLVPVRYPPFGEGSEVVEAIDFLARSGARIVSVQSDRSRPWPEFRRAMAAHPEILFVIAAGNEGLNLDRTPRYPTVYDLPNVLVVAGSDSSGRRLWPRSNYGGGADMIAFRAENVAVQMFDGTSQHASGTSFAAPAVAGIAARLLAAAPDLDSASLKEALIARARSGGSASGVPVLSAP